MKVVVYTCITGNYDTLKEPILTEEGWDYICFTDNPSFTSHTWTIRTIPDELNNLDNARKNKLIKVLAHVYLKEYDLSIYIDGNITINFQLDKLVRGIIDAEHHTYLKKHPSRHCIYEEAKVCERLHKDEPEIIHKQIERYHNEGFPKNFGMSENNILIRLHNDKYCAELMDAWASEIVNGSKRDQLSLFYCIWKLGTKGIKMFKNYDFLKCRTHKKSC